MLRLSRFLPSTSRGVTDLKDVLWSGSLTFKHALSTSAANVDARYMLQSLTARTSLSAENASVKKYASYTVFKGKAALSISPILPLFTKVESGGSRVDRNGSVMLTFFPAVGQRKYDYTKKQLFALSPTEVGSLISLGPAESCEFFHDPSMKSSTLYRAIIFSLSTSVSKTNERLSVPVTKAEFAVMRTALSKFIISLHCRTSWVGTRPYRLTLKAPRPQLASLGSSSQIQLRSGTALLEQPTNTIPHIPLTRHYTEGLWGDEIHKNLSDVLGGPSRRKEPQRTGTGHTQRVGYNPAETNPCSVIIPDTTFLSSTTGRNCTGEGGDSIFSMASTAIASAVIVLGFLKDVKHAC
uniref:Single-stranded DNA-bindig protein WHY2, mitochondrial n=1 Tax=Aegilops tauschii TaxID=37682 RepID=N1QWI4_AEGTA